jgi:hypothetical protein
MPCCKRVRKMMKWKGVEQMRDANCAMKDTHFYQVRTTWRGKSDVNLYTFCDTHGPEMVDRENWARYGVARMWNTQIDSIEKLTVEEGTYLKSVGPDWDVKYALKKMFRTKKYKKMDRDRFVALVGEAWDEYVIEDVNSQ